LQGLHNSFGLARSGANICCLYLLPLYCCCCVFI